MAAKNEVLLTFAQVETWRKERDILERDIREKTEKLKQVKIKLEAAEIFAGDDSLRTLDESDQSDASPQDREDEGDRPESISDVLCANLRETGDSLRVDQVRDRLVSLGFGDILRKKPNYVYGLVFRLTKSGRLLKRGLKYRAAPIESPDEETEATGASARH